MGRHDRPSSDWKVKESLGRNPAGTLLRTPPTQAPNGTVAKGRQDPLTESLIWMRDSRLELLMVEHAAEPERQAVLGE